MPFGAQDIIEQAELGDDLKSRLTAAPGTITPATDFIVTSEIPAPRREDYCSQRSGARAGLTNRKSPVAAAAAREGADCPVGLAFPGAPS
jgi:hypothetical protein